MTASAAAVVLLLGACAGTGGTSSEQPTATPLDRDVPASTETASPHTASPRTETPETAAPFSTKARTAPNKGAWDLVLTDVRVAHHDGFDRIVLELTGTGTPGWSVGYVEEAVLDGSGKVVRLGGDSTLDIYASGTTWPAPGYYSGPTRVAPADGGDVRDLYVAGTFEGYTHVLAGVDSEQVPFRAFALTDPPRLVVDVGGAD
jgi:hypothetical protein